MAEPTTQELAEAVAAYPHGRVPREVRRKHLLAVATDLFIEKGFEGASMDELSRRLGISKPVVYDLVGSKHDLYRDVVALEASDLAERIGKAVAAEPRREERLHAGALAFFRFVAERRAAWVALMSAESAPMVEEVRAARRLHTSLVASYLAQGAAEVGNVADPVMTDACARAINGATEALALWWSEHPEVSPESLAELFTRLVTPGLLALAEDNPQW